MRLLLCFTLTIATAGCLYIPTPQHGLLSGRGMIDAEETRKFRVGITTREDVLLLLGEPDATLNNQSVFLYTWTRTQGYLIIGGYGRGEIAAIGHTTLLLFDFDANNYLKRFELTSPGIFSSVMGEAQKWISEDMPKETLPDVRQ